MAFNQCGLEPRPPKIRFRDLLDLDDHNDLKKFEHDVHDCNDLEILSIEKHVIYSNDNNDSHNLHHKSHNNLRIRCLNNNNIITRRSFNKRKRRTSLNTDWMFKSSSTTIFSSFSTFTSRCLLSMPFSTSSILLLLLIILLSFKFIPVTSSSVVSSSSPSSGSSSSTSTTNIISNGATNVSSTTSDLRSSSSASVSAASASASLVASSTSASSASLLLISSTESSTILAVHVTTNRSINFTHLAMDHWGNIYVGGANWIFQLNSSSSLSNQNHHKQLTIIDQIRTGPIYDSPLCSPTDCSGVDESSITLRNNINKVLVVDEASNALLACGTVHQGKFF